MYPKINFRALQWGKGVGYVAGGGCAVIFALGGPRWVTIGLAVAAAAKLVDSIWPQPQNLLTPTAKAVDNAGDTIGLNVTTTTHDPLIAPQKGA